MLIGRASVRGEIARALGAGGVRLLTLTGPGGVGKTHLALSVATDLAHAYEDVTVVSLAACTDASQVISAMAHAIGVRERDARPIRDRLVAELGASRRLVVLDNVEQALPAVAPLLVELLAACPDLTVLLTSRAPLHIREEHEFRVPPLALPDPAVDATLAAIAASPAVQLFVTRARVVSPRLELTGENAAVIAEIVRRLDGLPLAIELAAARAKVFPPAAILERLDVRLAFLTEGPQDLPPRQRTLRAAIGWSYDLLGEDERALFRRLSIFAGGFTTEGVEGVVPAERSATPSDLAALLDWGLLTRFELPQGAVRFGMLETIREYGREQLERAGEAQEIGGLHLAWCLSLVERAAPMLFTAEGSWWLHRLQQEDANLQSALRWAFGLGRRTNLETGLRLAGALADFWFLHGRLSEGRIWLKRAIGVSSGRTPSIGRARVLAGACLIEQTQADVETAVGHCEQALTLARTLDDPPTIGRALLLLGNLAMMQGELGRARSLHEEAHECFRRLGDLASTAAALLNLGMDCYRQGQLQEAADHADAALSVARAIGDLWDTIATLRLLGDVARDQGELEQAVAFFAESLDLGWRHGSEREVADSLSGMGTVAVAAGNLELAARLLGAAEILYQRQEITIPPPLRPDWPVAVARIRGGLSADRFARTWAAAPPEQVIHEVIGH